MSVQQELSLLPPLTQDNEPIAELPQVTRRYRVENAIASGLLWTIAGVVTLFFVAIILKLLIDGAPSLVRVSFYGTGPDGIAKELFNTVYILIFTELFLFP